MMKLATSLLFVAAPVAVKADAHDAYCHGGVDLMLLQDTTGSFEEDLPIVLAKLPDLVNKVNLKHANSKFGVAEFKDKPYMPLGELDDFCYRLGEGKLTGDLDDFWWAYSLLYASGGADLPEAQYQALINAALDTHVGWRKLATPGTEPADDEASARVLVLITDAPMHLPGDIEKIHREQPGKWPDLPASLPKNSGTILYPEALEYECLYQDYPDATQVLKALKSMGIYLILLTVDDDAVTPGWRWFNTFLEQPADFHQFISNDSSDLVDVLLSTLDSVTAHNCPSTTSTTAAPETTTATTTQPATTTPTTTVTTTAATTSPSTTTTKATTLTTESTTTKATDPTTTTKTTTLTTESTTTTVTDPTTTETTETTIPKETQTPPLSSESTESSWVGTSGAGENCPPCPGCPCGPEVLIRIGNEPKYVHIDMQN